jgi:penicillin-binding protein 2
LAVFGIVIVACFVALFSRLWYLQVLAAPEYKAAAKENRVRYVHSEPPRGRIVDRNGTVLVGNRIATAVVVDRSVIDTTRKKRIILNELSRLLKVPLYQLRSRLRDTTVSPYKPIPVAHNVPSMAASRIIENQEDFFGAVDVDTIPIRDYPFGNFAGNVLGFTGEITGDQLKTDHFKRVKPAYRPGDVVGREGLEYMYDRHLRGTPAIKKVIVNSSQEVLSEATVREEQEGNDLVLYLDADIQRLTEEALQAGIFANRGAYQSPAGAAMVMDPNTGGVLGMASFPTYNPKALADGFTNKEAKKLGFGTKTPDDDAFLNRAIQAQRAPASTFKIVTAGAAMASGIASPYTTLPCPPSAPYPPEGETNVGSAEIFNNWTTINLGTMGFPESLEQSCDTFYYELGWRMEDASGGSIFGADGGHEEQFQKYARITGMGHETGVDLPYEEEGRLPDRRWCKEIWEATRDDEIPTCGTKQEWIWYPGYTINMSIGQGDLLTTPIQMAVATSAIANGGAVMQPRVAQAIARPDENDVEEPVKTFEPREVARLPLDALELSVIQAGMRDVVEGSAGTARAAFSGFPLTAIPIAGKTGTSELDETTELQDAWFVSYAPADDPQYVVVVYLEKSGHGGESAAPVAREIYEGIFGIDEGISVQLGVDNSG